MNLECAIYIYIEILLDQVSIVAQNGQITHSKDDLS